MSAKRTSAKGKVTLLELPNTPNVTKHNKKSNKTNSFCARKNTILHKAMDLNIATDAEVLVIMRSPSGNIHEYCSPNFNIDIEKFCIKKKTSQEAFQTEADAEWDAEQDAEDKDAVTTETEPSTSSSAASTSSSAPSTSSSAPSTPSTSSEPSTSLAPSTSSLSPSTSSLSSKSKLSSARQTSATPFPSPKRKICRRTTNDQASQTTESTYSQVVDPELCRICGEGLLYIKAIWLGCSHAKCDYWIHSHCYGLRAKSKAQLSKVNFMCPAHNNL